MYSLKGYIYHLFLFIETYEDGHLCKLATYVIWLSVEFNFLTEMAKSYLFTRDHPSLSWPLPSSLCYFILHIVTSFF
jgi:hypothetical protein